MKKISDGRRELDIRRPDGTTETVDVSERFMHLNDILIDKIRTATRNAGRGEVISYRNIEAVFETEESDYWQPCGRCTTKVDTRKSYSQMEWRRFGGMKAKVSIPYCPSCYSLLSSIGMGEITDLEHRASEIPSREPINKEE